MAISSCCADLNIFSIITKAYESNVKFLRDLFHLSQDHSNAFIYDNDISDNVYEIDSPYWQNYGRKDLYSNGVSLLWLAISFPYLAKKSDRSKRISLDFKLETRELTDRTLIMTSSLCEREGNK